MYAEIKHSTGRSLHAQMPGDLVRIPNIRVSAVQPSEVD